MSANLRNLLCAAGLTAGTFANVGVAPASPAATADAGVPTVSRQEAVYQNLSGTTENETALAAFWRGYDPGQCRV